MKIRNALFITILIGLLANCGQKNETTHSESDSTNTIRTFLQGQWVRMTPDGPMSLEFKENGQVEIDFGKDQTIDVVSDYRVKNDTVVFKDLDGAMCQELGSYKVYQDKYYVSFDLIDDNCSGRVKSTLGFWTRPNYFDFLTDLDEKITSSPAPNLLLQRARIYLALGNSLKAKADLDKYIEQDSTDARVYINRVGTRFPNDLVGAVLDCNKAITLGFSVLRVAEQEKCVDYWGK